MRPPPIEDANHLVFIVKRLLDESLHSTTIRRLVGGFFRHEERENIVRELDGEIDAVFGKESDEAMHPAEFAEFIKVAVQRKGLREVKALLASRLTNVPPTDTFPEARIKFLKERLGLSDRDGRILALFYHAHCVEALADYLYSANVQGDLVRSIAQATGLNLSDARTALSRKGRLGRLGLLTFNNGFGRIQIDEDVAWYLAGLDDAGFLTRHFLHDDTEPVFALRSFGVPYRDLRIAIALLSLNQPRHILIHGRAGTGKTEFARAIGRHLGKTLLVRPSDDSGLSIASLEAAQFEAHQTGALLVFDEADSLLFPMSESLFRERGAGWLHSLFNKTQGPSIWIVNDEAQIGESTRRRFSFAIHFNGITHARKRRVWIESLGPLGQTHPDLRSLPDDIPVQIAGLTETAVTLRLLAPTISGDRLIAIGNALLAHQATFVGKSPRKRTKRKVS